MRIGCLQFAPVKGDVNNNLARADGALLKCDPSELADLDLLVLPELAFSGYYFKSLKEIFPHLEPTGAGISSLWARTIALKYGCTVVVGYPEKVDMSKNWPASPEYYNSSIIVNADGEIAGGYRKTHLYTVDETWALEGQDGFFCGDIAGVENVTLGISTDLAFVTLHRRPIHPFSLNMLVRVISHLANTLLHSPYRFRSAFTDHEFAFHVLNCHSNLVVVSLAWPTSQDAHLFRRAPQEPDMETLMYWMTRLGPIIHRETDQETIVVFANRTGVDDKITYAGTSAVLGIRDGEVNVYGILGRSDKEVLIVDTNQEPLGKLVYRQDGPFVHGQTVYPTEEHPKLEPSPPLHRLLQHVLLEHHRRPYQAPPAGPRQVQQLSRLRHESGQRGP
ncbi:unnamed protein product [Parascedosporium putredinis]|uniref:CN hydrolase domain-containing protein n=1 Tax=Parascedosporium putredinis TaxID=1442378 RepID=A0A9P1GVW1_9PEZI|nr:unnamed protein product [Parascedosporium putredinis]CAI7988010.1 unnamed protein product [Parascedosporium putredinis]